MARGKHPCGHSRWQYGSFLFRVCVLRVYSRLTQNRGLRKDDDSSRLHDENVGTRKGTERATVGIRERRERRGSRALPREESTRRFVRWLVLPRLATTPDLYPYMLSGVIDYRERSISKVQRSSCDSRSRLPSAFVTADLGAASAPRLLRPASTTYPLHS